MMKSPDQQLYDAVFTASLSQGYTTYPFNPPPGTTYPYVKLGAIQIVPTATKSYLIGTAHITIDIWGDKKSRKKVSEMAHNLITAISKVKQTTEGMRLHMDREAANTEVMVDNSTPEDLWRARISLRIKIM